MNSRGIPPEVDDTLPPGDDERPGFDEPGDDADETEEASGAPA
ncbi:MAG: hypothetical protein ABI927_05130 [Gaiellaceae bacterium]